jgi:predicted TIM-barrel fold metal-dependent hydrolase
MISLAHLGWLSVFAGILLLVPLLACAQIKYEITPGADQRKTLLLRDYKPKAMLQAPVHNVREAKFPVIDIHTHVNDAMGINPIKIPPAQVVEMMDQCNIQKIAILTGMWGDKLQKVIDEMVKPYPDRFVVFVQLDYSKVDDPNFGRLMAEQVRDGVARGARGLKVLKDLGLEVRDKSGKLLTVDDRRLDPVWQECARLGIPVAIHSADPIAFFEPVDASNEQYEVLMEHPDWGFSDVKKFPRHREVIAQQERMFARNPNTTFIALHFASWPENLDYVTGLLDKYPNVMVEFGARQMELGRQPRRARQFMIDYPDRVLFGTDYVVSHEMYRNHFRWVETEDEAFEYWDFPWLGRWKVSGLGLPDAVLEKVYHLNAERIFKMFKGVDKAGNR